MSFIMHSGENVHRRNHEGAEMQRSLGLKLRHIGLLHGDENAVYADAGYTGVEKRDEQEHRKVIWQIAVRRSTYSRLNKRSDSRRPSAKSNATKPRRNPRSDIRFG